MNRVFAAIISVLAMAFAALGHSESVDIEGWNAWTVFTLSPVDILTPFQRLSFVFFSHCDSRTVIVFTPCFPTTIVIPLQKTFFSHVDAASQAVLEEVFIETKAKPLQAVYASHYDSITYIMLKVPIIK